MGAGKSHTLAYLSLDSKRDECAIGARRVVALSVPCPSSMSTCIGEHVSDSAVLCASSRCLLIVAFACVHPSIDTTLACRIARAPSMGWLHDRCATVRMAITLIDSFHGGFSD